jgi:cytochrome b pre-mRNA-processing protein 3
MILPVFQRSPDRRNIHALYGMIVAQARSAVFYTDCRVPDTVQGRFELIVLHLVLLLRRLARGDERWPGSGGGRSAAGALGQHLFDLFCRDLDANLREMGVGDLAVPRHMRRFGEAFYGRQAAYHAALAAADSRELERAIARNILDVENVDDRAARLARYARAAVAVLDAEADDAVAAGKFAFPSTEVLRMRNHRSEKSRAGPWRVPVALEDVAETGERFDLTADADTRDAVARMAGLNDLPRLQASFDVRRHDGGLRVTGHVSATVGQVCVVTLEVLANEVEEDIDLLFVPKLAAGRNGKTEAPQNWDEAEPLVGGQIDLGALATEFLILGLDPYPRKAGVIFEPPPDTAPDEKPFAALAVLKKDRDGR